MNELVQLEFEEISYQVSFERDEGAKSYFDLLKPGVLHRVSLGASLQMWSQCTGVNLMMYVLAPFCRYQCLHADRYYIIYVFQGAGLTPHRGNLIADSVQYVLNVLFTVPAILYIDKWGRRPMLLVGTLLMAIFLFIVGALQGHFGQWGVVDQSRVWLIEGHSGVTIGVIVCSYLFVCRFVHPRSQSRFVVFMAPSFALTMGPVSWTYPAEIFPMRVRAKAIALSTASNWLFNFALAWAVPPALSTIAYKTYFIFGTFNLAAFIHIFFMFPETAGRTLEEVEEIFAQGYTFTAWRVDRSIGRRTLKQVVELRDRFVPATCTLPSVSDLSLSQNLRKELIFTISSLIPMVPDLLFHAT
jgi:MFS family permease